MGRLVDGALRVVVIADELDPHGGAERSQLEVSEALAEAGHQIVLVYSRSGAFSSRYDRFVDRALRVPAVQGDGTRRTDVGLVLGAARAVGLGRRADVVYANSVRTAFFASLVGRPHRVPLVGHLRYPEPPASSVKTRIGTRAVNRWIAVSEDTRANHVRAGFPPGRVEVVHNGIDVDRFPQATAASRAAARARLGIAPDAFTLLYSGRLDEAKGIDVLLRWWGERTDPGTDILLVAGAPRVQSFEEQPGTYAESLRRIGGSQVRWLGRQLDMVPLFHACDVVVVPSVFQEPFGRVVVEAMACGRPVVASRVGGMREIFTPAIGDDFLVPPGDPAALGERVLALRGWAEKDPGLGERLRSHVRDSFSLGRTVRGVERVLRAAAGSSGQPGEPAPG